MGSCSQRKKVSQEGKKPLSLFLGYFLTSGEEVRTSGEELPEEEMVTESLAIRNLDRVCDLLLCVNSSSRKECRPEVVREEEVVSDLELAEESRKRSTCVKGGA